MIRHRRIQGPASSLLSVRTSASNEQQMSKETFHRQSLIACSATSGSGSLLSHIRKFIKVRIPCVLDLCRTDRGRRSCHTQLALRAWHIEAQRRKWGHTSSHLVEKHKKGNITFERCVAVFVPEFQSRSFVEELQYRTALQLVDCTI